eukprot:COSAG01_NODE_7676_length_3103_cov_1.446072_4_plen_82_part_00
MAEIEECIHSALNQLLRIFPACTACLTSVLRESFPHKRRSASCHVVFLRHVLRIVTGTPELYGPLLACVVEKCIELDVSAP